MVDRVQAARRIGGELPGVELGRQTEPVIWALVDSVAGRLDQRPPDGLRIVLAGESDGVEQTDAGRRRTLVLPLCDLYGLSCAELQVVIAVELGQLAALGPASRRIAGLAEFVGRTMAGLERRRSVLRRPLRAPARAFFGVSARLAGRRAAAGRAAATELYGREFVLGAERRAEALRWAFDWFRAVEIEPLVDRGWRPPLDAGFRTFTAAPSVGAQLPEMAGDGDATGDMLIDPDALEAALLGNRGPLVRRDWQDCAARVVLTVWDGHVRRHGLPGDGLRVWEVGQAVKSSVVASRGDQGRLGADLAALGSGLGLALAGDGWEVGKLPGQAPTLSRDGVSLRPDEEISHLRNGELTPATWIERCRRLGIGDLRVSGAGAARGLAGQGIATRT
jgi:hypothetical protein